MTLHNLNKQLGHLMLNVCPLIIGHLEESQDYRFITNTSTATRS